MFLSWELKKKQTLKDFGTKEGIPVVNRSRVLKSMWFFGKELMCVGFEFKKV